MVKIPHLYQSLVHSSSQQVSFRNFEKLLAAFGFQLDRVSGSHRIYVHPQIPRPFPVQPDGKDAKRYQVRELLELIEAYGLHIEK